jgi:hypothetical protein
MKKAEIILRFLLPPYQYTPETIHPTVRPLGHPATGFEANLILDRLGFFTPRANMSGISKFFDQGSYLTRIIRLIQTHALRFLRRWLRANHRNTLQCCFHHFAVMPVRPGNLQTNRDTIGFRQQTTLNAPFSSIRRIGTGFFPRPAGLWSSRHPWTAMTSQSLSPRHTRQAPSPRVSEKRQLVSIPEIVNAWCYSNKYPSRLERSIDSWFAIRKRCRPWPGGRALSAGLRRNDACWDASGAKARSFPTVRRISCICFLFFDFSSLNPFRGTIASEYIGHQGVIRIGSKSKPRISQIDADFA